MEFENRNFLEKFNDNLVAHLLNDNCFLNLYPLIKKGQFPLSVTINYDEKLAYIRELKKVVDKITTIVFKPHIISIEEDIITRSEIAPKVTREGFAETMRDSRLWKNKNGHMTPEFVHSVENNDSIETYENKFITLLIKIIEREIKELLNNLTPEMVSLEQYYQTKGLTFASKSLVSEFNVLGDVYQDFLYKKEDSLAESLTLLAKINKRIKNIKRTQFYSQLENKCDNIQIMATNILIHDNIYSYCYRFYKNNLQNFKKNDSHEVQYYNYFVISLLNYLADNNLLRLNPVNKVILNFAHDGRIILRQVKFGRGMFDFRLNSNDSNDVLTIDTLIDNKQSARTYIFPTFEYNAEMAKKIKEIEVGDAQKFVATCLNLSDDYNSILTYKYTSENRDYMLKNLIASLALAFSTESDEYDEICPVCGRTSLSMRENDVICNSCHSRYQVFVRGSKKLLWIKSLRKA